MDQTTDIPRRIIDTALRLAAEKGWRETSLTDIAAAAGVTLADLYRHFDAKAGILAALTRQIDAAVLESQQEDQGDGQDGAGAEETLRDRLFDVIMRRFDALAPYKEGLRAIMGDLRADPLPSLAAGPQLNRSMAWMMRAAGLEPQGAAGLVRSVALAGIYVSVVRVWLDDDTPDLARTMAALDSRLRRLEPWLAPRRLAPRRRPRSSSSAAAAPPV